VEIAAEPVPGDADLRCVLDEELNRLPEKYRLPVLLCCLQGKTHEEAAHELHLPLGTLKCRVLRGRDRLRICLGRRGLALSTALLTTALASESASATPPMGLVDTTVKAALMSAAGNGTAGFAPDVVALAEGAFHTMFSTRIKLVAAAAIILGVLGSGAGMWIYNARAESSDPVPQQATDLPKNTAAPEKAAPTASPLDGLWADLAGDEAAALRAVLALAARPEETVSYFKDHLKPVLVDPKRIARLIAELDHGQFTVRQKASQELEATGEYAVPYLEGALKAKPPLEVQNRIEKVLDRLKSPAPPVEWVRAVRAIAILEQIGSADARQILQSVKGGRTKAWPTQEAEAALDHLTERLDTTLEATWKDLETKNEAKVARAMLALAATPKETVDFAKKEVEEQTKTPGGTADAATIRRLITQLDATEFASRDKASRELTMLGDAAIPYLREATQDQQIGLEGRRRAELTLKTLLKGGATSGSGPVKETTPLPRVFTQRVVILLEGIGTVQAKELVETIQKDRLVLGHPEGGQVVLSHDGKLRARGEADGSVHMWDVATGKELWWGKGHQGPVTKLSWSRDGATLISVGNDQVTAVWEVVSGKLVSQVRQLR
jgi:hypothetical protein